MYLRNSLPPAPPPKDDESVASSRPESLVATLVEELEVLEGPTVSAVSMRICIAHRSVPTVPTRADAHPPRHCLQSAVSPQLESPPALSVECTLPQPTPEVRRRASQRSMPRVREAVRDLISR